MMTVYYFRAVSSEGEVQSGQLEEESEKGVVRHLHNQGLIPLSIDIQSNDVDLIKILNTKIGSKGISEGRLLLFTQQLATLMQAGISLDRALEIMIDVGDDGELKAVLIPIKEGVRKGLPLSEVLAGHPDSFSHFYISMVQASEASGDLGEGLEGLGEYLERSKTLKEQVLSALIYPIILVVVSAASLLIILTYVVPQFTQLFEGMGEALPISTQFVIAVAEGLKSYLPWILVGGVLLWIFWRMRLNQPAARSNWDARKLKIPLFGPLNQRIETARFTRSLGTLVGGGVPLLNALSIARETLTNRRMAEAITDAIDHLKEGEHLAKPLRLSQLFPSLAIQMIQVGEETGRLEEMLLKVANLYDREVGVAIKRMLAILTPALIVSLGIVIAGIIMSILVAIMSLNDIPI
ncbi:type II secretion system F family protein [uncultured Neptuniibacter sp.]|uniref:type II secretion system F family protein n=1 Tax=uncultured Neptuniibacter sp. TaxID=502143 RepID=UPI002632B053|nr:type II secretion system F family protein [uncultured Neptuniibacter sp.]